MQKLAYDLNNNTTAQYLLELFIALMTISYALEGFWVHTLVWKIATGALSLCVMVFAIFTRRLYRYNDVQFLILFLVIAWISGVFSFGLTGTYFISRFHCFWLVFLALYMAIHIVPDPSHAIRVFFCVSAISFSGICLYMLGHAARSLLFDPPGRNLMEGCFRLGRLCALKNANVFSFMCTALLLVSLCGFLTAKKRIRILYLFSAILGWFTLGLTGSRTCMISISFACGLLICSLLFSHIREKTSMHIIFRWMIALALGIIAGGILLVSFYLPLILFRWIMLGVNGILRNPYLAQNLADLTVRRVTDDDGTMSDRVFIWGKAIKDCFQSVRRALFGISPLSSGGVPGVYAGHHEIETPHAHSIYLDTLRRFGLLGFLPWVAFLLLWIRRATIILFKYKNDISDRFLASCVAGILVMGLAEPVPFSDIVPSYLAIPFFVIIGYCMRKARTQS